MMGQGKQTHGPTCCHTCPVTQMFTKKFQCIDNIKFKPFCLLKSLNMTYEELQCILIVCFAGHAINNFS